MINRNNGITGMRRVWVLGALLGVLLLAGCGGGIDVVDAGTYAGTVEKAVAEEQEIYVELTDGTRLELYFTEDTELVAGGNEAPFSMLAKGIPVEITLEREGNRNIPTRVEIRP